MPLNPSWQDIALRLSLTFVAGALIGYNRGEHGRPAGLRTTILVCIAASVSMIQANLLLATAGKNPQSFVVLDLMRLPLGILSGMGFIGGGAILKKGNLVLGVTTAATLWFVTVMGLCFGGGQINLGLALLILGLLVLWGMKKLEQAMYQEQHLILRVSLEAEGPSEEMLQSELTRLGMKISSLGVSYLNDRHRREINLRVQWKARPSESIKIEPIKKIASLPGVISVKSYLQDLGGVSA